MRVAFCREARQPAYPTNSENSSLRSCCPRPGVDQASTHVMLLHFPRVIGVPDFRTSIVDLKEINCPPPNQVGRVHLYRARLSELWLRLMETLARCPWSRGFFPRTSQSPTVGQLPPIDPGYIQQDRRHLCT